MIMSEYESLLKLQAIELELDEIKEEASVLPSRVKELQEIESKSRIRRDRAQAELQTLQAELGEMEKKLELEETRLTKSKSKVRLLTKEYEVHALEREIELTKRSNGELTEEIQKKKDSTEALSAQLETYEKDWDEKHSALVQLQDEAKRKKEEFDGILTSRDGEKKEATCEISKQVLKRFLFIRDRKHQDALVECVDYACQGCFMNIPPQMFNEMMREDRIDSCPHCGRLIYIQMQNEA